jgi:hypothetical protein
MNATFTSYALVRMMPAGQAIQQPRTIRRTSRQLPPSSSEHTGFDVTADHHGAGDVGAEVGQSGGGECRGGLAYQLRLGAGRWSAGRHGPRAGDAFIGLCWT